MPSTPNHPVQFDLGIQDRSPREVPNGDRRFRILVCADFSGLKNRGLAAPLSGRMPVLVDVDNLDRVIRHLRPQIFLTGLELSFGEMDDFHPDQIYHRTPGFQSLVKTAARSSTPVSRAASAPAAKAESGSLLDAILDEGDSATPAQARPAEFKGDLADFIQQVTAPHLVPREDPGKRKQEMDENRFASAVMNGILHHPDFQSLESAWRGIEFLVRNLNTDGDLKIYVLDATLEELRDDPDAASKLLARKEHPWTAIVALYTFGQTSEDAKLLAGLGKYAASSGAPLLAESEIPGEPSPEWTALRRSPEAHSIGLITPRFLLRLPYGKDTSPIDAFPFEEMPLSEHQCYLWGNPAICAAYLLGQAFLDDGWDMRPGTHRRVQGLPLHTYKEDGEINVKPCAEVLMTESEAEFLLDKGIMPLASLKEKDEVMLVRFQSIAEPAAPLSGFWGS
jgi:type VI secretion system protein ImpC